MGTIRFTPGDGAGLYEHEGHLASVLDDRTDTGSWTLEVEAHTVGYRAACECGWRGPSPSGSPARPPRTS
jgi:hypothetical protein